MGDPLVGLNDQINWEAFRPDLNRVHKKERKSNAGAKPIDAVVIVQGAGGPTTRVKMSNVKPNPEEVLVTHDPVAEEEARRVLALDLADAPALLEKLQFMDRPMKAVQGADALIIVTEWKAYRSPNWPALKTAMKATVIFDGRKLYESRAIKSRRIEYHGIGRFVGAHR